MEEKIATDKSELKHLAEDTPPPSSAGNGRSPSDPHRSQWLQPVLILLLVMVGALFLVVSTTKNHRTFKTGRYFGELTTERPVIKKVAGHHQGLNDRHLGHSFTGAITAVSGDKLTIHNSSGDQIALVSADTSIYKESAIATKADLKVGEVVSIKGKPGSDGQLTASTIQIW